MTFIEIVERIRKEYPELQYLDDVDLLVDVEAHLQEKSRCDDLTQDEKDLISLLSMIREYLQ